MYAYSAPLAIKDRFLVNIPLAVENSFYEQSAKGDPECFS